MFGGGRGKITKAHTIVYW